MANSLSHYIDIAALFDYPGDDYYKTLVDVKNMLATNYPDAVKELEEFETLLPKDIYKLQELYTKSFEVQAITSLEIGYLLYGDDYTRGEVMVGLSQEHKAVNNECGDELSDHLANVLRLIGKMKNRDTTEELIKLMVAPAVENMMKEFIPSSIENKNKLYKKQYKTLITSTVSLSIFVHLINALYTIFDQDFELIKEDKPFGDKSFFGFLKSEIEIEEGKQSSNKCGNTFNASGTTGSCT